MSESRISHSRPRIGFLPIGRPADPALQRDCAEARETIAGLDADIVASAIVWEQPEVLDRLAEMQCAGIDLLVVLVLQGMSAEQQVLAGIKTDVPTVLWALPTNYSFSSSASARGALRERGRKVELVLAAPDDATVLAKLGSLARAGFARGALQRTRIATVGGIFPNLPAAAYHRDTLTDRLGPQVVHIPMARLRGALAAAPEEGPAVDAEIGRLRAAFQVGADEGLLRKAIRLHWALREMAQRERLTAVVLECHTELTPLLGINPCFGFTSEGPSYFIGCEGDVIMTVAMLMAYYLTGRHSYLGDLFTLTDGVLTLAHCGADCRLAAGGVVSIKEQTAPGHVGAKTRLAMCVPEFPAGPATVFRLHGPRIDKLHLAMGDVLASDIRERLVVQVRLHEPAQFLEEVCANHYVVVGGDARPQFGLLCEWLGIALTET